jgi:hypothetical protein
MSIPKWAKIGGICVLAAALLVGGYLVIRSAGQAHQAAPDPFGGSGGAPTGGPGAGNSAPGAHNAGVSGSSSLDSFASSFRKAMEAGDMRDAGGSIKFADSSPNGAQWSTAVVSMPGRKVPWAKIELPYCFTAADPKQSCRGNLTVYMALQEKQWVITGLGREVWYIGPPGTEKDLGENRQASTVKALDPLYAFIQGVTQKAQKPGGAEKPLGDD